VLHRKEEEMSVVIFLLYIGSIDAKFYIIETVKRKINAYSPVESVKGDSLSPKKKHADYTSDLFGSIEPIPTEDPKPTCSDPPCFMREIQAKIYVTDDLWSKYSQLLSSKETTQTIHQQVKGLIKRMNGELKRLDEGGYVVKQKGSPVSLKNSDIQLGETYVDRLEILPNVTKKLSENLNTIYAHAFAMQQAVEKMPNRWDFDLRILFNDQKTIQKKNPRGVAEEKCICKRAGFGCIIVFSVKYLKNWAKDYKLLAHEVGHTLGADPHDNEYYDPYDVKNGKKLMMWSKIYPNDTFIWSPHARKKINLNGNTCLKEVQEGEKKVYKQK